jgi:hypothetical protein
MKTQPKPTRQIPVTANNIVEHRTIKPEKPACIKGEKVDLLFGLSPRDVIMRCDVVFGVERMTSVAVMEMASKMVKTKGDEKKDRFIDIFEMVSVLTDFEKASLAYMEFEKDWKC